MDNIEQTAAAERERLLTADALGHFWHGEPLQPWSARRELLFLALQEKASSFMEAAVANTLDHLEFIESRIAEQITQAEDPALHGTTPAAHINWARFLTSASIVLWLAHHTPEQWAHLRADPAAWLLQIESWADDNIAADELQPAVRLARALRTAHRQLMTLPRPDATTRKRGAGN